MKDRKVLRLLFASLVAMVILASCSSDDETATAATTTTPESVEEAPETTDAADAPAPSDADAADEAAEADIPTTTIDERTDLEIATDNLDVTSFQLGVEDLEGAADCVIERLDSEGIPFTGEGTAELIALIRCEPDAINSWLPETNPVLFGRDWTCTVGSVGDWLSARSIPEAEEFLSAGAPPQEFFDLTAETCGIDAADVAAALS